MGKKTRDALVNGSLIPARNPEQNAKKRRPHARPSPVVRLQRQDPEQNAKKRRRPPRFAGPAPTASTWFPDAFGQYPGGSRSEDDPCLGLRRLPTGGACGSSINTASV